MGRMYARVRNEQNGAKIMNEVKRNADEAETARRNKIRRAYVLAGVGVLILALIYLVYTAFRERSSLSSSRICAALPTDMLPYF